MILVQKIKSLRVTENEIVDLKRTKNLSAKLRRPRVDAPLNMMTVEAKIDKLSALLPEMGDLKGRRVKSTYPSREYKDLQPSGNYKLNAK